MINVCFTDRVARNALPVEQKEPTMSENISPKPPARVRGRPFEKGRSGNLAAGDGVSAIRRHLPPQHFSRASRRR